MRRFSHVGADGKVKMVDVSAKPMSVRTAVASGKIWLSKETISLINKNDIAKGNVLATARIAAIQAAKKTAELIPLCHPLPLSDVEVEISNRCRLPKVFPDAKELYPRHRLSFYGSSR